MNDYFGDDKDVTFDDELDDDEFCAECGWSFGDHDPECSEVNFIDEEVEYGLEDCE